MSQYLPDQFDPWRFADLGKRIDGSYWLKDLPRLSECLVDSDGEVIFSLAFSRGSQRRACLSGTLEATLILECQRCLESMDWPVKIDMYLGFVEGLDEAEKLPEGLDPHLVEHGQVKFRDLIEDELLLALPQVAMHSAEDCDSQIFEIIEDGSEDVPGPRHDNPFAALAGLKRKDN